MIRRILHTILVAAIVMAVYGCTQEYQLDPYYSVDEGSEVCFVTYSPHAGTKATQDEYDAEMDLYKPVGNGGAYSDYKFRVAMYESVLGNTSDTTTVGRKTYQKDSQASDGSLVSAENDGSFLYWPGNARYYAFKATTIVDGSAFPTQDTYEDWMAQDKLTGYGHKPLYDNENETGKYKTDDLNFLKPREWYAIDSKQSIPLYMNHDRAWVTVILKAGEGVSRDALAFDTHDTKLAMTINSFASDGLGGYTKTEINPFAQEATVDYDADKNGPTANGVSTTRYDAFVEPFNYYGDGSDGNAETYGICSVSVSNQNFSFYASNDYQFQYRNDAGLVGDAARARLESYNLHGGDHLVITATVSRASRQILISAYLEEWDEVVISSICDDYGQDGEPMIINNVSDLQELLSGDDNKPGTTAILNSSMTLADNSHDLNCTLNLAGFTLKTNSTLFNSISSTGSIINGTVQVGDPGSTISLRSAIAKDNYGSLERVSIIPADNADITMSVAGFVETNYGVINQCSSSIPVNGTTGVTEGGVNYIGGIAAVSKFNSLSQMPVIIDCSVDAPVTCTSDVYGGGIVGYAQGRVSANNFRYGVTLSQDNDHIKNIVFGFVDKGDADYENYKLSAYSNKWPTLTPNYVTEDFPNENTAARKYSAVLCNADELGTVISTPALNTSVFYGLVADFEVSADSWNLGDVNFTLDGNDYVISLTRGSNESAPMLFNEVRGSIQNLNISLDDVMKSVPVAEATDAIAPLAFAVNGGTLSNVNLTSTPGVYVMSATPSGLVVWAYNDAVIEDCSSDALVKFTLPEEYTATQAYHYAGGIVACSSSATITRCKYTNAGSSFVYVRNGNGLTESDLTNAFYGGIVGGSSKKEDEVSVTLTISDCASRYAPAAASTTRGAIIGFACYVNGAVLQNAMSGCEGNWWNASNTRPVGKFLGNSVDKVIGKRNSSDPWSN